MVKLSAYFVCLCFLISGSAVNAQNSGTDLNMACEKYENCLKTGHCAIITSALIHLMKMYHQYPDHNYARIVTVMDSLAEAFNSKPVCTKALLAKQYLTGKIDLDWLMDFDYEDIHNFLRVWYAAGYDGVVFDHSPALKQ